MPKRPPKKWFNKKSKEIRKGLKEAHPTWGKSRLDEKTRETVGDIWYNKLSESKRKEILGRESSGNPGWKGELMGIIALSVIATLTVIIILWLLYLKRKPSLRLPADLCVGLLEDFIELVEWPEHLAINFFHQINRVEATASVEANWPKLVEGLDLLKGNGVINELQYQCGLAQGRIIYGQ